MDHPRALIERQINEDLVLVRLTEENKQKLLRKRAEFLSERQSEAEKIHQRLDEFNHDLAENFGLKERAVSKAPLRMIFSRDAAIVQGPTPEDLIQSAPSYLVVSYCWLDPENPEWNEAGSGERRAPWPIQYAFVEALLQFRESKDEGIWIDQLSIDQSNEDEKQLAIGAMDVIYGSARRLVITLEDIEIPDEEEYIVDKYWDALEKNIAMGKERPPWTLSDSPEDHIRLMKKLFQRVLSARWFSRAWCSHEFRVSRFFADDFFNQPHFWALSAKGTVVQIPSVLLVSIFMIYDFRDIDESRTKFENLLTLSTIQTELASNIQPLNGQRSLIQQVHDTLKFSCTQRKDIVQIAINLSGLPIYWTGTANSDDEIYWIFTLLALAAGQASLLGFNGTSLKLPHNNEMVKSWARRSFDTRVETRIPIHREDLGIASLTPEFLDIDLLFLDKPVHPLSAAARELADRILRSHHLYNRNMALSSPLSQEHIASLISASDDALWRRYLRDVLACFLDGGVGWMRSAWRIFNTELIKKDETFKAGFGRFENNPDLCSAAREILTAQDIDESNMTITEQFLLPVVNLLAVITDRRFLAFAQAAMRVQTSSDGDQALVSLVLPGQKIAVPTALAGQECTIRRLWTLEAIEAEDGTGAWRMVNKQFMLGCPTLVPDGNVIIRKEKQRVYGGNFIYLGEKGEE